MTTSHKKIGLCAVTTTQQLPQGKTCVRTRGWGPEISLVVAFDVTDVKPNSLGRTAIGQEQRVQN